MTKTKVRQGADIFVVELDGLTKLVEAAAKSIAAWLWADSKVHVTDVQVAVALLQDMSVNDGWLPTEEECEALVCAEQGSQEMEQAKATWPNTDRLLAGLVS